MKITPNRFAPEAAAPRDRSPLAERLLRHRRWSAAISAAFVRADPPLPWRSITFTFGPATRRMWSLVRRVLNLRLSWPPLEQRVAIANHFVTQSACTSGATSPGRRGDGFRIPEPHRAPPPFRHTRPLQTFSRIEKLSRHLVSRCPTGAMASSGIPPARTVSRVTHPDGVTREASVQELTTKLMRRLTRTEELPLSPEPMRAFGASMLYASEATVEAPPRTPHRDPSAIYSSENASGIPIPAAVSVTQLTDEVMRQIDRRLVAVRERMGRI